MRLSFWKNRFGKRVLSLLLVFGMLVTLPSVSQMTAYAANETTYNVTVHYNMTSSGVTWDNVYTKFGAGDSWTAITGYEYCSSYGIVSVNEKNSNWYSFSLSYTGTETAVNGLFYNGTWGGTNQTGNWSITLASESEVWFTAASNGDGNLTLTKSTTAPDGWTTGATVSAPTNPADLSSVKSPVINDDGTVTFNYEISEDTLNGNSLCLMGTLTDWNDGKEMTDENGDGVYSITLELSPGAYQYKFKYGDTWVTDPQNASAADGNSLVIVSGLCNTTIEAKVGDTTSLPEKLTFYDADGNSSEVTPTYTLTEAVTGVSLEDSALALTEEVSETYFTVTAAYGSYTATVYVDVVTAQYNYHIYYYADSDDEVTTDSAALWLYGDGVDGSEYAFTNTVTDDTYGYKWLTYTWTTSLDAINIIPKAKTTGETTDWSWQSSTASYANEELEEDVYIYIIYGSSAVYTEVPDVDAVNQECYVLIEYIRDEGDYDDWNIYTWDNGYNTTYSFNEYNGSMIAAVRVASTNESVSFCMRRSTTDDEWAEKDGGDHIVKITAGQQVTKVVFKEGEGVVSYYPDNAGYELLTDEGKVNLYYRDDELYLTNEAGSLNSVQVCYDDTTYSMTYNSTTQRWEYNGLALTEGQHKYYYLVKETEDSEAVQVADAFNENTDTTGDAPYSTLEYYKFDAAVTAELYYSSMDYNDNNVLTVGVTADEITVNESETRTFEASSVVVDLTKLGGDQDFAIKTELMEGTIAVTEDTAAGVYELPVTVTDQYSNTYTGSVEVTVTERDKGDDFDWEEAVIYFAVTDRFYDGNTDNNDGVDTSGSLSYHGGDFAGLTEKLDYLEDLGVNTIWITPIVENSDTTTEKDGETIESTGYHGYWASNFEELNSHLGTEEEFAALVDAVHDRGMKIMVDVVLNHAGYGTEDYFNSLLDGDMIRSGDTLVDGDTKLGSLSGLPDFITEDEEVRDLLIAWQTAWVSKYDIDYYRVDTVKHVDDTTWAAFKNALTKIDPDFKMIGEYSGAGYASDTGTLGTGEMDSLLDFDFNDQALSFVQGNLESVESFMESRSEAIDNTATLGAFTSSHDEDGLMQKIIDAGYSEEEAYNMFMAAASLQLTAEGQVVIYYGEEIGLYGQDNYPYQTNRYDFDWSEAQNADGTLNTSNTMLAHYNRLLAIRDTYSELMAKGDRVQVAGSDEDGYLVFQKTYDGETVYVGINLNDEAVTVSIDNVSGSGWMDVYADNAAVTENDGTITVTIPALSDGGTVILGTQKVIDVDSTGSSSDSSSGSSSGSTTTDSTDDTADTTDTAGDESGSSDGTVEDSDWEKQTSVKAEKDEETGLVVTVNTREDGTATITKIKATTEKTITVPSTVTVNGEEYTVTKISNKAFAKATEATKIVLPSTITKIGAKAFSGAKKVKTIVINSTDAITVSKTAFKGLNTEKITVKVKVSKNGMTTKEYKSFKKALKAIGFKGTIKKK